MFNSKDFDIISHTPELKVLVLRPYTLISGAQMAAILPHGTIVEDIELSHKDWIIRYTSEVNAKAEISAGVILMTTNALSKISGYAIRPAERIMRNVLGALVVVGVGLVLVNAVKES